MSKVIFLVPIFEAGDIFDEWVSHIKKLNPKPHTIVFAENNSTDDTLQKILDFKIEGVKIELIRFWTVDPRDKKLLPFEECYKLIAHARQLLLSRARSIDPDYAIFIDSDIMLSDEDKVIPIVMTRGCPYRCTFCCTWIMGGKKFRIRGVDIFLKDNK